MSVQYIDNLSYRGKKGNFERDHFSTLSEMRSFSDADIDEGHLAWCDETSKRYEWKSSNSVDGSTGRWREVQSHDDSKQDKLTAGTGIAIDSGNVISCTLDNKVFVPVSELPTDNILENKIYLVPNGESESDNVFTEYTYVNGAWEVVGSMQAKVDLTPYAKTTDVETALATKADSEDVYTKAEVDTKGFVTIGSATETSGYAGFIPLYNTSTEKLQKTAIYYDGIGNYYLGLESSSRYFKFSTSRIYARNNNNMLYLQPTSVGLHADGNKKLLLDATSLKIYYSSSESATLTYDSIIKLDGIAEGAEVNQNAFSKVANDLDNVIEASDKQDTLRFNVLGDGLDLELDQDKGIVITTKEATTELMGMMTAADKKKLDGLQDLPVTLLTQSEYDALTTKDADTLYIIRS